MPSDPIIFPVHTKIDGRARYRVAGLRGCAALKQAIETHIGADPRIVSVSGSCTTGTVLLHYTGALTPSAVARMLRSTVEEWQRRQGGDSDCRTAAGDSAREDTAPSPPWPILDADTLMTHYGCDPNAGLSGAEARDRLRADGPNAFRHLRRRSRRQILSEQFRALPPLLMGLSAGMSAITGAPVEGALTVGAILVNAAVGYGVDLGVETAVGAMHRRPRPKAEVIRDGRRTAIPGEDLVVGDVVLLEPGIFVGADCRLVAVDNLKVDESVLTGESMPVEKTGVPLKRGSGPISEMHNMVFMGTLIVGGKGKAVVVATGEDTEYGRLHALIGEALPPRTPVVQRLERLNRRWLQFGLAGFGAALALNLVHTRSVIPSIRRSLVLLAGLLPAGLPASATLNMALGIRRLKASHVSVRRFYGLETLGGVRTICFDKTGTITRSRISVARLHVGGRHIRIQDRRWMSGDRPFDPSASADFRHLIMACALCNESKPTTGDGAAKFQGSPTESALFFLATSAGADVHDLLRRYPLIRVRHRGEHRRRMLTVHPDGRTRRLMFVKGDPGVVLGMCDRWGVDGDVRPLTAEARTAIEQENDRMAGDALRVLGFAYKTAAPDATGEEEAGFVWIGLVGMAEPIRRGVRQMIARLHAAGIRTVMITGDQNVTAFAVANRIGLAGGADLKGIDSSQFAEIAPELLAALTRDVVVYSRVNPAQKLQIVRAFQDSGHMVAMTGDGINDGPAMRAADIGIAMGIGGTDVAREVADLILEKDDLTVLPDAITTGRTTYRNLKKTIRFFLTTHLAESLLLLCAAAAPIGAPLLEGRPGGIGLSGDVFTGLALLAEPADPEIATEAPQPHSDPILERGELFQILRSAAILTGAGMAGFVFGGLRYGPGAAAGMLAFESLATARVLHGLNCRTAGTAGSGGPAPASNPYLRFAVGLALGTQIAGFVLPGWRRLTGRTPLDGVDLLGVLAIGAASRRVGAALGGAGRRRKKKEFARAGRQLVAAGAEMS